MMTMPSMPSMAVGMGASERLACIAAAAGVGASGGSASTVSASPVSPASPAGSAGDAVPLRLGLVGVGTINSAVCRGLCTAEGSSALRILVGPRNAAKSAALAEAFPGIVTRCTSSQAVLDGSDIVLLATRASRSVENHLT